ncbi:MAG: NIPSNAP family protein [Ardenticatenaceae bacterium]|nr:NIPSNAP family protein [Ardenticatenaceae bacterium]HBY95146.1 NIPSNAP family protein [Chloroflexota bacterium]
MLYELRVYDVLPGKMGVLLDRFHDTTTRLFERHAIVLVGAWTVEIGESNTLIYLVAHEDWEQREQAWSAFRGDAEWHAALEQSERDGPLLRRIHNRILRPTEFSPLQ